MHSAASSRIVLEAPFAVVALVALHTVVAFHAVVASLASVHLVWEIQTNLTFPSIICQHQDWFHRCKVVPLHNVGAKIHHSTMNFAVEIVQELAPALVHVALLVLLVLLVPALVGIAVGIAFGIVQELVLRLALGNLVVESRVLDKRCQAILAVVDKHDLGKHALDKHALDKQVDDTEPLLLGPLFLGPLLLGPLLLDQTCGFALGLDSCVESE